MIGRRQAGLVAVIGLFAFAMAFAGVFVGRAVLDRKEVSAFEVHSQIYLKLNLRPEQHAQLASVEAAFNSRRRLMEKQMREASQRLAVAIEVEHGYGPQVTKAIDDIHLVMGDLQKETVQYLFAMRAVLDDKQTAVFDDIVVDALTTDAQ